SDVRVVDKGVTFLCGDFSGTKKWGAGAGVGDCTTSGSTTFSATTFPTTNQATATGHTTPGSTDVLSKTTDSISCSSQVPALACTPNPLLTVDKVCVTTLQPLNSNVVVRVDYTGQVHNNGNVFINNVSVVDTATGTPSTQTFTVGQLTNAGTVGADKCYTT